MGLGEKRGSEKNIKGGTQEKMLITYITAGGFGPQARGSSQGGGNGGILGDRRFSYYHAWCNIFTGTMGRRSSAIITQRGGRHNRCTGLLIVKNFTFIFLVETSISGESPELRLPEAFTELEDVSLFFGCLSKREVYRFNKNYFNLLTEMGIKFILESFCPIVDSTVGV